MHQLVILTLFKQTIFHFEVHIIQNLYSLCICFQVLIHWDTGYFCPTIYNKIEAIKSTLIDRDPASSFKTNIHLLEIYIWLVNKENDIVQPQEFENFLIQQRNNFYLASLNQNLTQKLLYFGNGLQIYGDISQIRECSGHPEYVQDGHIMAQVAGSVTQTFVEIPDHAL